MKLKLISVNGFLSPENLVLTPTYFYYTTSL